MSGSSPLQVGRRAVLHEPTPLLSRLQRPERPAGSARGIRTGPRSPRMGVAGRSWSDLQVWAGSLGVGGGIFSARRSSRMRSDGPAMAAPEEPLRRRKAGAAGLAPESPPGPGRDPAGCPARLRAGTFWLTRIVLLKALAFVYCESAGPGAPVWPLRSRPAPHPQAHPQAGSRPSLGPARPSVLQVWGAPTPTPH